MDSKELSSASDNHFSTSEVAKQILDVLADLKFGSLQIIVQDGVVVQIEKTEKFRVRNSKR
ncbi:MAG: YezD family protein [Planctomycetaceae bacterium]|nr:YezD family protein [Planctomycetaceae bacterium]